MSVNKENKKRDKVGTYRQNFCFIETDTKKSEADWNPKRSS